MLSQPCLSRVNFTWLWYLIIFIHCWVQFANILLSTSASMFMSDNWSVVFLTSTVFGFGIKGMLATYNEHIIFFLLLASGRDCKELV